MLEILHAVYLEPGQHLFVWAEGHPAALKPRSRRHPFALTQGLPEGEPGEAELELQAGPLPSWGQRILRFSR